MSKYAWSSFDNGTVLEVIVAPNGVVTTQMERHGHRLRLNLMIDGDNLKKLAQEILEYGVPPLSRSAASE